MAKQQTNRIGAGEGGCEFCNPADNDPYTNRPASVDWRCPYCDTQWHADGLTAEQRAKLDAQIAADLG